MAKEVIIIGGGNSVRQGIDLDLWNKIKGKNTWSLNYSFRSMPYLPTREIWIDHAFFTHNVDDMLGLWKQGVNMVTKTNNRYALQYHDFGEAITQYQTTRERKAYKGKPVLKDLTPFIFCGRMGLTGIFALSLAVAEGYDLIYLLGYDFGTVDIKNSQTHFYQGKLEVWSTGVGKPTLYRSKHNIVGKDIKDFEVFKQESETKIVNVSPESNIKYFEKIDYPQFFERLANV